MKIYLAGPMRGYPDWNFPAFDAARKRLTERGYRVFCPASLFRAMPYSRRPEDVDHDHLVHVISSDLACIYASDAIALLPGWEASRGATVELAVAQFIGLKVICAETTKEMSPPLVPWSMIGRTGVRRLKPQLVLNRPCRECGMTNCKEPSHG